MGRTILFAVFFILASHIFLNNTAVTAGEGPNLKEEALTGDWGGSRTRISEKGINWEIVYKTDVLSNISGGFESGSAYMDNMDVKLKIDGSKALGWQGGTALLYILSNHGGKLNGNNTHSFMGVSNIEVNAATTKLYQAWLMQSLFDDKLSLLAGLYDLNSEFYATDSSGLFLHPSYGMGPEVAQTGFNGPSIFPTASLGFRIRWQPSPKFLVQAVALNAMSGNPNNPYGTHIIINKKYGALLVAEADFLPSIYGRLSEPPRQEKTAQHPGGKEEQYEPVSKYAVGVWRYTARFDDLTDKDAEGNPLQRFNEGIYVQIEQSIFHEMNDKSNGLTAFIRCGLARDRVNHVDRYISSGLKYKGLFPGRKDDQFGLAFARVYSGSSYRQSMQSAGTPVTDSETSFEMTYRIRIKPWLAVQPDIQFIMHPGLDPYVKNAWIAGSRIEVSF